MQLDLVYREIGEFSLYAKFVVYVGALTNLYAGLVFLISIFTLGIPEHRCAIPGWENDTYAIQDDHHLDAINTTIPLADSSRGFKYDKCNYKSIDDDEKISLVKCDRWVYDKSVFETSLAADLNMVCERSILKSNAQMFFFGGLLSGSLLTGIVSDRFGRKPTLCISSIFYFLAALCIAWTPNYAVYVVLTFCVGFFSAGNFMPAYVMGMELVGPSKRRFAALAPKYMWVAGNVLLAGIAYFIRDWRTLQIVCAAPGILFQLFWFIFPESPRWMYTQGKIEECKVVIRKAAEWEKVKLPDRFFDKMFTEATEDEPKTRGNLLHMFTSKRLFIRTMIIFFCWIVVCLSYYGLALNSSDFGVNIYLSFMLQAVMDLPAALIVLFLLDRIGRRPLFAGSLIIGGLGCLSTVFTIMFTDSVIATTVLAMIGKVGAFSGFVVAYVFSAELFPTVVRNAGLGASSCLARVGGMIAPYIADLDRLVDGRFGEALPQIVFGVLSIMAGLLALNLPETLDQDLPETIKDGEMFGRKDYQEKGNPEDIGKELDDVELLAAPLSYSQDKTGY